MRLFFGMPLSGDALPAAISAQASLRALSPAARLRFTDASQLHFTLAFLGALDEPAAALARDAGRAAIHGIPRFPLPLGPPGAFPTPARPRVLWLGAAP